MNNLHLPQVVVALNAQDPATAAQFNALPVAQSYLRVTLAPDGIEATNHGIARGRCVAISIPDGGTEKLVAIIKLKDCVQSDEDAMDKLASVKTGVAAAISTSHGLRLADPIVVHRVRFVCPSGEVSRGACVGSTGRTSSPAWTFRYQHEY